eukprot:146472-Chlamydomonas_euryale.AAC.1
MVSSTAPVAIDVWAARRQRQLMLGQLGDSGNWCLGSTRTAAIDVWAASRHRDLMVSSTATTAIDVWAALLQQQLIWAARRQQPLMFFGQRGTSGNLLRRGSQPLPTECLAVGEWHEMYSPRQASHAWERVFASPAPPPAVRVMLGSVCCPRLPPL